jgi:hypothetical protein
VFDPTKEHFAVIHHVFGEGDDFKLLGVVFDVKLSMSSAVDAIVQKAGPKLTALLRTRFCYDSEAMIQCYKSHVLCVLEAANSSIYHACDTVLARLDTLQHRFLRRLSLTESEAFVNHNLAPLGLRRDIGMLGLLFKCIRKEAHPELCSLFALSPSMPSLHNTRLAAAKHDVQVVDEASDASLNAFRRSIFGLVKVWNLLPFEIVHSPSVSCFQKALTALAKRLCVQDNAHWAIRFSPRSTQHVLLLR